jgi:hypothetical protein
VTDWLNDTGEFPLPSAVPPADGARVPNASLHVPGSVVEKRKYPLAEAPFGFAWPLSVADVAATDVAAFVETDGARAVVVKGTTAPNEMPIALFAIAQK